MTKNVGGIDKTIRVIVGIVFVLFGLFANITGSLRIGAFIVAAIALFTAFVGF